MTDAYSITAGPPTPQGFPAYYDVTFRSEAAAMAFCRSLECIDAPNILTVSEDVGLERSGCRVRVFGTVTQGVLY